MNFEEDYESGFQERQTTTMRRTAVPKMTQSDNKNPQVEGTQSQTFARMSTYTESVRNYLSYTEPEHSTIKGFRICLLISKEQGWLETNIIGNLKLIRMIDTHLPLTMLRVYGVDDADAERDLIFEYELPLDFEHHRLSNDFIGVQIIKQQFVGLYFREKTDCDAFDNQLQKAKKDLTMTKEQLHKLKKEGKLATAQAVVDEVVDQIADTINADDLLSGVDAEKQANELRKILILAGVDIDALEDEETMQKLINVIQNFDPNKQLEAGSDLDDHMVMFSYRMVKLGKRSQKKDKQRRRKVVKKVNKAKRDAKLGMIQDKERKEKEEQAAKAARISNTQLLMEKFEQNAVQEEELKKNLIQGASNDNGRATVVPPVTPKDKKKGWNPFKSKNKESKDRKTVAAIKTAEIVQNSSPQKQNDKQEQSQEESKTESVSMQQQQSIPVKTQELVEIKEEVKEVPKKIIDNRTWPGPNGTTLKTGEIPPAPKLNMAPPPVPHFVSAQKAVDRMRQTIKLKDVLEKQEAQPRKQTVKQMITLADQLAEKMKHLKPMTKKEDKAPIKTNDEQLNKNEAIANLTAQIQAAYSDQVKAKNRKEAAKKNKRFQDSDDESESDSDSDDSDDSDSD